MPLKKQMGFVMLLLVLLTPSFLVAQTIVTGGISGTVTDPTGKTIPGASLTLTNIATGEVRTTPTNSIGIYEFPFLKPGNYTVTVKKDGFQQAVESVQVLLGQTSDASAQLQLGSSSTTVQVTGKSPLLQTEDANISTNFDNRTIQNIPTPGNDMTYIAQFAPGVIINSTALPGSNGGSGSSGAGNFSAFGLPAVANLFTFNGNDLNDPFRNVNNSGASNLTLGLNDIQEVTVVTNAYSGEYGRQAGAQVDFTSRAGTNEYHGNAAYYWNGSDLNAKDYFLTSAPKPFQNNNQWAASLGGPIKKNKAFFFVNTEGIRYIFGTSNDVLVPTPAFETYTLSHIPASATTFYQKIFGLYNATPGISRAVPQAGTCGSISPAPAGGNCLEEFQTSASNGNQEWLLQVRGDYDFNENNKVFAQLNIDRGTQPSYTDPISSLFNITSHQPMENGQLNYTHIFSPTAINNFVGSIFYYSTIFQSANLSTTLAAFPFDLTSDDTNLTSLGPGAGQSGAYPSGRRITQWQLVDDFSLIRGNHTFKMGINFRRDDVSDYSAATGSQFPVVSASLASFATDQADSISQTFAKIPFQPIAYYNLGLYFQDEYRVDPKLKLTLSLRADRNSPGVCQSNCGVLSVKPFDQLSHGANIPYNQMMQPGRHQLTRNIEAIVFEPRIGAAWQPFDRNTVVRGGIGMFTDLYPGQLLDLWTRNFPSVTNFSLDGTLGTINPGSGSAATLITNCNTAFQTNYNNGGTLAGFQSLAPSGCETPSLYDVTNKTPTPKYVEWNFEVQHTFGPKTVLSINYVGNHGYDEIIANSTLNAFDGGGFGGLPKTQPDQRVGFVYQITNNAVSNYNGVTVSLKQDIWRGFTGRINYTYSHSMDDISDGGLYPLNPSGYFIFSQISPFNMKLNYGPSDSDAHHNLTAQYVWSLPFKSSNRLVDTAVGGWQVSGTFFAHSGFPFSVDDALDAYFLFLDNGPASEGVTVLGQPVGNIPKTCTSTTKACWTSSQFSSSPTTFGTIRRNSFRGPGYFNTDFSVRKDFRMTERLNLQVGANAFNLLNHPNFANPDVFLGFGPPFGTVTSTVTSPTTPYGSGAGAAEDARIVQLIAKLSF